MHELSLALEIRRIAATRLPLEAQRRIRTVAVGVGERANVEPESLRFSLTAVFAEPPFSQVTPVLLRREGDALTLDYLEVDDGGPDDRGP
ncbi:MAG TPA: hydrogenase/urease maturation nickel metallochaperone HypA [Gemmatimonadales bacterium]|nr:hydrogenase/urease maturation nickel metallochaperone HypA [Gemmatimonadales bacterium]